MDEQTSLVTGYKFSGKTIVVCAMNFSVEPPGGRRAIERPVDEIHASNSHNIEKHEEKIQRQDQGGGE